MASKKASPKKVAPPAKKASATTISRVKSKIVLNKRQLAAAKSCLETSGKITVGMREIVFTKLPKAFDPPVSVD